MKEKIIIYTLEIWKTMKENHNLYTEIWKTMNEKIIIYTLEIWKYGKS